jgi:RNA polymerase sigma-70 factor (ECF subfamily)
MDPMRSPSAPEGGWAECLDAARAGCPVALGRLLERFRPMLLAIAARGRDPELRAKAGESDLVQDSLLEGQKDFPAFRGESPDELLAWLKQILAHNLANFRRRYRGTEMRTVRRELEFSAAIAGEVPACESAGPEAKAARREELARLQVAIDELPEPAREIVIWRQRDALSFEEIGARTGRTPEGVRQVWWRAVHQLRSRLRAAE